jgi:hypothetical protein
MFDVRQHQHLALGVPVIVSLVTRHQGQCFNPLPTVVPAQGQQETMFFPTL